MLARRAKPLAPEAFHGLAGELIRTIEPHSEADPAGLLIQFLVSLGNVIGRGPFYVVEQHPHYANLFALIVGTTSKGRKGTAWARIAECFRRVDERWSSNRVQGGIGSGEGVIWNVRDEILKGEKLIDEGEPDKLLLLLESEFAQVLAVAKREGSTASEVLRRAWDGTVLQTLTKNNSIRATGACVSLIGHITMNELLRHLNETEIANGLMNRFLFVCVRRSKCLPDGGSLDDGQLAPLIERLRTVISSAKNIREMKRDSEATRLWHEVYGELSAPQPGLLGAVISRGEAQVLRLSMLYALLDSSVAIRRDHLLAALSVWEYAEASAKRIFGDSLGDRTADLILRALRGTQAGLTRTEISGLCARNRTEAEIALALSLLTEFGLARMQHEESGGRPVERWFARVFRNEINELSEK